MSAAGNPWPASGAPLVLVAEDGRRATIQVCEQGIEFSDGGGTTVLAHVEEDPNDPNRLKIAGRWFRLDAG